MSYTCIHMSVKTFVCVSVSPNSLYISQCLKRIENCDCVIFDPEILKLNL